MTGELTRRSALAAGTALAGSLSGCITDLPEAVPGGESGAVLEPGGETQNWRQHRYDLANTGVNPSAIGPDGKPSLAWTYRTGDSAHVPTVVDETVYVTGTGRVFAVDLRDGSERWATALESTGYRGPTVFDGTVYVTGIDRLYALDATTGEQRWSTPDAGPAAPVVDGSTIYTADSRAGQVFALTTEGDQKWAASLEEGMDVLSTPAYADGVVVVATGAHDPGEQRGFVRALEAETGDEIWTFETRGVRFSAPAIADGVVFVPDDAGTVYAIDIEDGSERWAEDRGESFACPPAVDAGTVFIGSTEGRLSALGTGDGSERWSADGVGFVNTGPTVAEGTVYLASNEGLLAHDSTTGQRRWRVSPERGTPRFGLFGVVVSGGAIFTGSFVGGADSRDVRSRLFAFA